MKFKITVFSNAKNERQTSKGETIEVDLKKLKEISHQVFWSPCRFKEGKRKREFFEGTSLIVLDIDDSLKIEEAKQTLDGMKISYIISPTRNHQKQKGDAPPCDRFRIIAPLDKEITDVQEYRIAYQKFASYFRGVDMHCRDTARFFFPCVESLETRSVLDLSYWQVDYSISKDNLFEASIKRKVDSGFNPRAVTTHRFGAKPLPASGITFLEGAKSGWPSQWNGMLNNTAYFAAMMGWTLDEFVEIVKNNAPNPLDDKDMATIKSGFFAGEGVDFIERDGDDTKSGKKFSRLLLEFLMEHPHELIRNSRNEVYARIDLMGKKEVIKIYSDKFQSFLCRLFYERTQIPIGDTAIKEVQRVLSSKGLFEGKEEPFFMRVGFLDGSFYYDIGDGNSIVKISAGKVEIVPEGTINFIRTPVAQATPLPDLDLASTSFLHSLLNLSNKSDQILIDAFIIASLMCNLEGYPILVFSGEQGTGKSFASKLIQRILDPSLAPGRSGKIDEEQISLAAASNWLLFFDNISRISAAASDILCRTSTGGTFTKRKLYTDCDLVVLTINNPVIMNGIEALPERPDLAERSILINLPFIPKDKRKSGQELQKKFKDSWDSILGGYFELLSNVLLELPNVQLKETARMADFCRIGVAVEKAGKYPEGFFMKAYMANQDQMSFRVVEEDSFVRSIVSLVEENGGEWKGSVGELFEKLSYDSKLLFTDRPTNLSALGIKLRRMTPVLRNIGIDLNENRTSQTRFIFLKKVSSPSLSFSPSPQDQDEYDF